MTPKQQRFVDEYLIDLNATQAAIRAGYSERTARQAGAENLSKPDIATAIEAHTQDRSERTQIDADMVLQRLAEIDAMDVADILDDDGRALPIKQWPGIWRRYITTIDVSEITEGAGGEREVVGLLKKLRWPDKVKNLELIGRHVRVQAWKEKREQSGNLSLSHEEALELLS
jgi:phage terminase small subunit